MKRYIKMYWWSLKNSYSYMAGLRTWKFWVKLPWKAWLVTYWTIRDQNRIAKVR